jgi:hypothetical protein
MPAGLIEEENSVHARSDFGCDLIQVKLHSFGVAGRQHEGGAGSAFGADCTEQVGRLGPLIVGGTGASTLPRPAIGVLAETRSDRWYLVERSGFGVRRR